MRAGNHGVTGDYSIKENRVTFYGVCSTHTGYLASLTTPHMSEVMPYVLRMETRRRKKGLGVSKLYWIRHRCRRARVYGSGGRIGLSTLAKRRALCTFAQYEEAPARPLLFPTAVVD